MSSIRIRFTELLESSPYTYWAHQRVSQSPRSTLYKYRENFQPPLPVALPGKGYVQICVEYEGRTYRFCSLDEIIHVYEVLKQKTLPDMETLVSQRKPTKLTPEHWLKRFPQEINDWKYRKPFVKLLESAIKDFRKIQSASMNA